MFTTVLSGVRPGLVPPLSSPFESAELPGRGITVDRNATEPVPEEDVVQHDQSVAAKRGAHQYRHEQVRLLRWRWIVPFLHWPARREEWHQRSRSVGGLAYMVFPPMLASADTSCACSQQRTSPEEAEEAQLAQESVGSDRCGQADEWLSASCRAGGERSRAVVAARAL